jgi:hypothetical protein
MAWYVREHFEAGLPIPPDREPPANGSPLFQALVRRQVQSLDWLQTPLNFWWSGAFGAARAAHRSREIELPHIHAKIEGHRLAAVGLVRHQGLNPMSLKESHQVLGYGYEVEGEIVSLRIYDPNWPDRDDVVVAIDPQRLRQSTGETLFGILSLG